MRKVLVGTGTCLTLAAFVAAERLHSTAADAVAFETETAIQAALDDRLTQSKAQFVAETAALKESSAAAEKRVTMLTAALERLTAERDQLKAEATALRSGAEAAARRLSSAEAIKSGMLEKVEVQHASLVEKQAELEVLRAQIRSFASNPEIAPAAQADDSDAGAADAELLAEIASLSESLQARDETIASLQSAIEASDDTDEGAELTAAALERAEEAEARLAELTATLEERETVLASLEAQLEEQAAAPEVAVVAEGAETGATEEIESLEARLAALAEQVAEQSDVIATLRMGVEEEWASTEEMAAACFERANKIFEISQINFATGTASISQDSMTTLDHLRDLAIGCQSEDMFIEIGGHTDSYGAEAANQTLSEARAQSVRDFLIGRGIPADTMVAVGFGETQPIASNDSASGRAQNRRITFSWQMRGDDAVEQAAEETVTNEG